jgi:hypothetical protein
LRSHTLWDTLWVETRDAEQKAELWRGPPNVTVQHEAPSESFLRP